MRQELRTYAELEGAELGDAINALLELKSYEFVFDPKFNAAVETELRAQLRNFTENSKIVSRKEMIEREVHELEWND